MIPESVLLGALAEFALAKLFGYQINEFDKVRLTKAVDELYGDDIEAMKEDLLQILEETREDWR